MMSEMEMGWESREEGVWGQAVPRDLAVEVSAVIRGKGQLYGPRV